MRNQVKEEVDKMLKAGIVESSDSPYAAPVVLVRKKDNTIRFWVDFRALNSETIFDKNIFDIYVTEYGTALTTILPILFLYLNTVTVTAGTFES
jgi:hypothetical protein